MKANELMIGDWVQDLSPVVIDAISNEDICTYQCKDGYITVNPSNLKPLPLTPEILEKNGFEADEPEEENSAYRLKEQDMIIVECFPARNGYRGIFAYECTRIRKTLHFVHELQHAMRLCGIKKEITV